jgi:hypothetical protein
MADEAKAMDAREYQLLAMVAAAMVGLAVGGERAGDRTIAIITGGTAAIVILLVAGAHLCTCECDDERRPL